MEGRAPYLAPDIWPLFPDRLDAEGKPKGWRRGSLSDLMEIGPSLPAQKGAVMPYLDMASLPPQGCTTTSPILRAYSSGTRFQNGDTLLARITPCLENGKTAFIQNFPANAVGWGSTEFIVMRSISPVPKAVSYLMAREPAFRRHAIHSMTGTSGRQRASTDAISGYPVTIPPNDSAWLALDPMLEALFGKIAANAIEMETLAAMRDLLLPKLMSGEVRTKDAEKIVGEAT
jgi:type I restriction enzyme S subunit